MNTNLILKSLYKINNAAKTLAVLKQDAYDNGAHRMCGAYKIEQNRLYTLKTLAIQQLVSDGVLKRSKSVLDYKGGLLSEFATSDGDFCFHSVMESKEVKDTRNLAVYQKNIWFEKCYNYKPYEKCLIKFLSDENREIYELLCECYDMCVKDRLDYKYKENERRIVKILNLLKEKFNIDWEVYERYIGDGATEYDMDIYKDGYLLSSSIYLRDNQDDFGLCFFGFDDKLYYGDSQWHNDVKSALVCEEDIEGDDIEVEKTEFYEDCIIFKYYDEYEETEYERIAYYDNYKRYYKRCEK